MKEPPRRGPHSEHKALDARMPSRTAGAVFVALVEGGVRERLFLAEGHLEEAQPLLL